MANRLRDFSDTLIKVVGGSMKGSEFKAQKGEISFGRGQEADIQIHDPLISRVHCKLNWEGGNWYIEDLNSTNGSWMMGKKLTKKSILPLRTSVRIGNSIFELFNMFSRDDTQSVNMPLVTYRIQPETMASAQPVPAEQQKDISRLIEEENKRLSLIYKFQNQITSIFKEDELYPRITKAIMNTVQCDTVFLLIYDVEGGHFVPVSGRKDENELTEFSKDAVNANIVEFVRENHEAVLSTGNRVGDPFKPFAEGGRPASMSIMCVPMFGKQQLNGMMYVSLTSAEKQYSENDLRLLTVLGHTAGMALENTRLIEFNLKNERLVATGTTAAGLSHCIKNIIAGLDGSLNLLKMGIDENDMNLANEALLILSKNHRRLGNLALDLLNLTTDQKLNLRVIDLDDVITELSELMAPQFKQENISISVTKDPSGLPLCVEADEKGLHRVILNLLTNAEQAVLERMEKTGPESPGKVIISARFNDEKDHILVSIVDNGVGIETEKASAIFDMFATTKGMAGSGLGLAVSRKIIEAHGGTIYAAGQKDKGCTMTFSVPVGQNDAGTSTRAIKKMFK
jgi:signal transduction histidine kinase/pSer/pThr/pTyr-binding forkhead associated (FHA) protein